VLPAAEKVALSPDAQAAPAEPVHQGVPPVQLPSPPAVLLPALLQVTLAASRFKEQERRISEIKNVKTLALETERPTTDVNFSAEKIKNNGPADEEYCDCVVLGEHMMNHEIQ
jgi:hypothetical protein